MNLKSAKMTMFSSLMMCKKHRKDVCDDCVAKNYHKYSCNVQKCANAVSKFYEKISSRKGCKLCKLANEQFVAQCNSQHLSINCPVPAMWAMWAVPHIPPHHLTLILPSVKLQVISADISTIHWSRIEAWQIQTITIKLWRTRFATAWSPNGFVPSSSTIKRIQK